MYTHRNTSWRTDCSRSQQRAVWPAAVLAEPPAELTVAAHTEVDVPLRLLVPQFLLKLQGIGLLPEFVFLPAGGIDSD